MKTPLVCSFLIMLGLMIAPLRAQPAPRPAGAVPPAPTTQQLQESLDAKQYAQVLKDSQRMLALKGPAAKEFSKSDVLMLRAEAYVRLKQQSQAIDAYKQATKETDDPTKAGLPKAMVKLIGQSKAFMYTPKPSSDPTKPSAPLDISDPAQRKIALKALFDDEWKPTQTKIDALKRQGTTQLPPILEAAQLAGEMRGLELAATGKDAQTSTALSDLTDSAAKLMTEYIDRQTRNVDDIDHDANRPQSNSANDTTRMGVTAVQAKDLKMIISNCEKLTVAAELVANSAGAKANDFRIISDRSTTLGKKATDVLNADYNQPLDYGRPTIITTPGGRTPTQRGGYQQPR
jgi:hypothetical protein